VKPLRLLPVVLVVALLVALTGWWEGSPPASRAGMDAPEVPVAGGSDELSSTWYCAAGVAGSPSPPGHSVFLANPADEAVTARLTGYTSEGPGETSDVEVEASGTTTVSVAELLGSSEAAVMVESASGSLVVEHRLSTVGGSDQVPCATSSSEEWFFPAQTTTLGSSARLVLFNPFSSDAGVDISAAVDDGIRVPAAWSGLVIPAGTARVIDLGEQIQRRELFSLSVVLRNGRVVAETVQTFLDDGRVTGLRMQLGVPRATARWGFAGGFSGPGASERLVVFNPGEDTASVVVQVTPIGGAAMSPEPFQFDVAGRRYATLDLAAEGRVPDVGHHAIQVETDEATPVVVGRVILLTGGPDDGTDGEAGEDAAAPEDAEDQDDPAADVVRRPGLSSGTTIGTGSPLLSTDWLVPLVVVGEDQEPAVVVHNPSQGIVTVSLVSLHAEGGRTTLMEDLEVPAGDGVVVPLAELDLPDGDHAIVVAASDLVLVERLVTFARAGDITMGLAVPAPSRSGGRFPGFDEV
jgi:hypothetical protein